MHRAAAIAAGGVPRERAVVDGQGTQRQDGTADPAGAVASECVATECHVAVAGECDAPHRIASRAPSDDRPASEVIVSCSEGFVVQERGVADGQCPSRLDIDSAGVCVRRVAGECVVRECERSLVLERAAVGGRSVTEGQAGDIGGQPRRDDEHPVGAEIVAISADRKFPRSGADDVDDRPVDGELAPHLDRPAVERWVEQDGVIRVGNCEGFSQAHQAVAGVGGVGGGVDRDRSACDQERAGGRAGEAGAGHAQGVRPALGELEVAEGGDAIHRGDGRRAPRREVRRAGLGDGHIRGAGAEVAVRVEQIHYHGIDDRAEDHAGGRRHELHLARRGRHDADAGGGRRGQARGANREGVRACLGENEVRKRGGSGDRRDGRRASGRQAAGAVRRDGDIGRAAGQVAVRVVNLDGDRTEQGSGNRGGRLRRVHKLAGVGDADGEGRRRRRGKAGGTGRQGVSADNVEDDVGEGGDTVDRVDGDRAPRIEAGGTSDGEADGGGAVGWVAVRVEQDDRHHGKGRSGGGARRLEHELHIDGRARRDRERRGRHRLVAIGGRGDRIVACLGQHEVGERRDPVDGEDRNRAAAGEASRAVDGEGDLGRGVGRIARRVEDLERDRRERGSGACRRGRLLRDRELVAHDRRRAGPSGRLHDFDAADHRPGDDGLERDGDLAVAIGGGEEGFSQRRVGRADVGEDVEVVENLDAVDGGVEQPLAGDFEYQLGEIEPDLIESAGDQVGDGIAEVAIALTLIDQRGRGVGDERGDDQGVGWGRGGTAGVVVVGDEVEACDGTPGRDPVSGGLAHLDRGWEGVSMAIEVVPQNGEGAVASDEHAGRRGAIAPEDGGDEVARLVEGIGVGDGRDIARHGGRRRVELVHRDMERRVVGGH